MDDPFQDFLDKNQEPARVVRTIAPQDVADELGLTVDRIYQLLKSGELPSTKAPRGQWLILPADVDKIRVRPKRGPKKKVKP